MKKGQNLIEFLFVFPILIFLTLGIFEVALFWQDVNSIYSLNSEINANAAIADTSNMQLGGVCQAATNSLDTLKTKGKSISWNTPNYSEDPSGEDGKDPFKLYKYVSDTKIASAGNQPQITLWVDCRNPYENGITTQLQFFHKTTIMKASIPRFDKPDPIVIIPDNVFIASPKLNTIKHY